MPAPHYIAPGERVVTKAEERRVIIASSVGTVFEWYDFYLYAILAPFFAALFFPPGNATAALLGAFGAYAAGFLVRPFGALIFGRIGDLVGRKYTFLVTIVFMGLSTVLVGFLPSYKTIGFATAMVAAAGNIYYGLWYPIVVSVMTCIIGVLFLRETKDRRIHEEH